MTYVDSVSVITAMCHACYCTFLQVLESTLRFDDVEDIPGLLPLVQVVQRSRMQSREWSGRWPGNEAKVSIIALLQQVA